MTAVNRLARDNNGQGVRLSQSRRPCDSISGSCLIPEVVIQPPLWRGSRLLPSHCHAKHGKTDEVDVLWDYCLSAEVMLHRFGGCPFRTKGRMRDQPKREGPSV
jgi:hypothetical protein